MITEAIDKITKEVNDSKNTHAQVMGEYLIDHITEESAAKILQEGKTIAGAISDITSKASKQKNGNMAMVRDDVVFGWLNDYFGIGKTEQQKSTAPEDAGLSVDLLDLM